jgi:outer membrane protein
MNRSFSIAILGVGLLVLGMVRADAQGTSPSHKVGYVDLQRTLNETSAGKQARKKLERDKARKQKELDKKQQDFQRLAADLDKQKMVLKPDVLARRQHELQQKYVELQETYMKLQQELAVAEASLVREIFNKASPVIQRIAQRDGYTMILEKNESAVLWAADALDITREVNAQIK